GGHGPPPRRSDRPVLPPRPLGGPRPSRVTTALMPSRSAEASSISVARAICSHALATTEAGPSSTPSSPSAGSSFTAYPAGTVHCSLAYSRRCLIPRSVQLPLRLLMHEGSAACVASCVS